MDKETVKALKKARREFTLNPDPSILYFTSKRGNRVKITGNELGEDGYWYLVVMNVETSEFALVDPDKFWKGVVEKKPLGW
jgi:hypothetical protein